MLLALLSFQRAKCITMGDERCASAHRARYSRLQQAMIALAFPVSYVKAGLLEHALQNASEWADDHGKAIMLRVRPDSAIAPAAAQLLPLPTMWPLQPVRLILSVE
jgi:hypothetical protein